MLAAIHTSMTGWDVVVALLVVLVVYLLTRIAPEVAWVALATLFGVALLVFALTVQW